ncbi:MAG: hypothetical protein FWG27_08850 [Treponema sp.]|jgi:hypothetical protein|nr:hypothetical protein [Treponema sp.]
MKGKLVLVSFFAALLGFCGFMALNAPAVSAQQHLPTQEERWGPANTSELYYVNVPIEKVYPYRLGYVVLFRKGVNSLGRAYIPYEWFKVSIGKALLIHLGDGPTWPCMSVFYKEGAFYGVKLYVAKRQSHLTWGSIPSTVNLDDRFQGVEAIDLGFDADQQ